MPTQKPARDTPRLLRIPEVADALGVHRATVYAIISRGEIPVVDIGAGRPKTRVRASDLDAYIESRTRTIEAA